ncbi:MAG: AI-2E family transporter, partial [Gemmatimonadaceae bacterium]
GWRTRDIARGTVVVLAAYAACRFLYAAHTLLFVAFLGTLLGLAVASGVDRLERWRVPRALGAGLIVVGAVALLAGFGAWTGPTVRTQYRELRQRLPDAFAKLDHWIARQQGGLIGSVLSEQSDSTALTPSTTQQRDTITVVAGQPPDSLSHLKEIKQRVLGQMSGASRYVLPVIHSTIAAVSGVVLVLFLAIYIGASPAVYRRGILALVPKRARSRWEQVLTAVSSALRRWLITQMIAMVAIGVVTTGVLLIFHVRAALPLGILAGLLEFVPTVGPILSAVPSIAMAFVDSPQKAAAVGLAYVGIQFLENHLLIPLLMKEGVDIPPVLTILTQAAMAIAFGVMGLFIAVPLLVLTMVMVKMLYVEDVLGNTTALPAAAQKPPDERPG